MALILLTKRNAEASSYIAFGPANPLTQVLLLRLYSLYIHIARRAYLRDLRNLGERRCHCCRVLWENSIFVARGGDKKGLNLSSSQQDLHRLKKMPPTTYCVYICTIRALFFFLSDLLLFYYLALVFQKLMLSYIICWGIFSWSRAKNISPRDARTHFVAV